MRAVNLLPPEAEQRHGSRLRPPARRRRCGHRGRRGDPRRRLLPREGARRDAAAAAGDGAGRARPGAKPAAVRRASRLRSSSQIPVVLSQEEPWHVALDSALATRVSWDVLLRQLEYVVPSRVSLTNVTVGGTGTTAGTSGTITIGGTPSRRTTSRSSSRRSRAFRTSRRSRSSAARRMADSSIQTFQITAQMAIPAARHARRR